MADDLEDQIKLRQSLVMTPQLQMHESTVNRVVTACRIQNLHGVWGLVATKRGIGITQKTVRA
jgi:hypothetical protein